MQMHAPRIGGNAAAIAPLRNLLRVFGGHPCGPAVLLKDVLVDCVAAVLLWGLCLALERCAAGGQRGTTLRRRQRRKGPQLRQSPVASGGAPRHLTESP